MSKSFYDLLNEQIGHEFAASHQYLSMAIWLDGEDLPQLAKFFYRQSLEEREHALDGSVQAGPRPQGRDPRRSRRQERLRERPGNR